MSDGNFRWPLRVYYEDTDAAGIVYYANYLKFMERARTEWLRSRGFNHIDLKREQGIVFVVSRLNMRYQQAARLDEQLCVALAIDKIGRASIDMKQAVYRDENARLCSATVRLACVSADQLRPTTIPHFLLAELKREN